MQIQNFTFADWNSMKKMDLGQSNSSNGTEKAQTNNSGLNSNSKQFAESRDPFGVAATLELSSDLSSLKTKSTNMIYSAQATQRTLQQGMSGSDVKTMQTNLNNLGYNAGTPDGIFGSGTKSAVVSFQKTYGLTADGIAGPKTLNAINSALNYKNNNILSKGQVSNDVKTLQKNLISLGYLSGSADGAFGSNTEKAVKAFQSAYGLTSDGLAGSNTQKKLKEVLASAGTGNNNNNATPAKGLSENGFKLLASYEATSAVKDKSGNVVSIPIIDVGDGMYTIGIGNTVKKTDTATVKAYKQKYGIDVTKVGTQVDIKTCLQIYNDNVNYYTSTVDSLLKRHNYKASQNEYDALVIAVYNRPALANEGHALDTLLKANNHNKDTWRTTLINEYKGLANWGIYGNGWTNRIDDEIELFFDGDYVRNH